MTRTIATIASEIIQEWGGWAKVNYAAKPYLDAMLEIDSDNPKTPYYAEDAGTQILYFLSNASSYRGPVAKAHKAELKQIVGMK